MSRTEDSGIVSRIGTLRAARGMAASALADAAGVSRQTIYAIEAGDFTPNTAVALRLARALEASVEDLFSLTGDAPPRDRTERVELLPGEEKLAPGQPVQLCRVGRRTVASAPSPVNWAFPASDGVFAGRSTARVFDADADFASRVLVAGCDPAISVLARRLARGGFDMVAAHRNSTDSLDLLARGLVHVAGAHLGEANIPEVLRRFPKRSVAVFSFAVWEQGIVTARGNPKHIAGIADLARRGVAIVNREAGSGSRRLLDGRLTELGIPAAKVRGYDREAGGHLPAAWQVHAGAADCCIATHAAARLFGLGFVPLATERYDLVVRKSDIPLPAVSALLEELGRAAFRREVESFGGYDARSGGDRVL